MISDIIKKLIKSFNALVDTLMLIKIKMTNLSIQLLIDLIIFSSIFKCVNIIISSISDLL